MFLGLLNNSEVLGMKNEKIATAALIISIITLILTIVNFVLKFVK